MHVVLLPRLTHLSARTLTGRLAIGSCDARPNLLYRLGGPTQCTQAAVLSRTRLNDVEPRYY